MGLFSFLKDSSEQPSPGNGKVLAFLNQKGGVGKTTMCFHTAYAIQRMGKRVLCLDLDPQSNLTLLFSSEHSSSSNLYNLLINSVKELRPLHTPVLFGDLVRTREGVDYLPGGQELSGFELTLAAIQSPRQLVLKKFIELNQLTHHYDYILIDGPPTLGLMVVNIVCAAHALIVPFKPDPFSQQGLKSFHTMLQDIAEMGLGVGPEMVAYIPNLVEIRRKCDEDYLQQISEEVGKLGGKIFNPFLNRMPLVKANNGKKSVFDYTAKEYLELQEEFSIVANFIEESFYGSSK